MRILTWNVNVLRTCLDYHPFTSMKKKNVEGLLDELQADIFCFQEHKTRRQQLEKSMACPGPYDGFWTFPRSKTGYSGVCTYVDSRLCVPLKAEEGITGLLLDDKGSTMRPPWTPDERIGSYPDIEGMDWLDEVDGTTFDPKRLDMEGRAVVCDFGLFVLFNLYSPNETNDTRRPYKMNFLKALQERVRLLTNAGREVIIAGDINIMRAPIDSGDGGIRTSAEQHYQHPARVIFNDWCAPKGPMIDVVRESWPDRDDMFTCWNQKLDARPSNYGSRIDYILCTPGLRPWIKGGDILTKVFGSDHCPVYIDLHDRIEIPGKGIVHLRDMLNPPDRPMSTATIYPNDTPRLAPEPPRFATKFLEEFSGRQTTLKNFFGGGGTGKQAKKEKGKSMHIPSPSPAPTDMTGDASQLPPALVEPSSPANTFRSDEPIGPFGLARAAFDSIDEPGPSTKRVASPSPAPRSTNETIDLTYEEEPKPAARSRSSSQNTPIPIPAKSSSSKGKQSILKASPGPGSGSQTKLSAFFAQPQPPAAKEVVGNGKGKRKTPTEAQSPTSKRLNTHFPSTNEPVMASSENDCGTSKEPEMGLTEEEDQLISQAIAEADSMREAEKAKVAPIWSNLFAKKLPPLCNVHHKPCKDFIVKIPGPNKGKRFWLCSLPVGAGYDTGRTKRSREDVNHNFRCDFFLWDSANSRKEKVSTTVDSVP